VENAPAVFATNGLSRMSAKKDGKRHAEDLPAKPRCTEEPVKNGTKRTGNISKTTNLEKN